MDIVCNYNFTLKIGHQECGYYTSNELDIYAENFSGFQIIENEAIDILFTSTDETARLYLEALDIAATSDFIEQDEEGRLYRIPYQEPVPLFENNNKCDALRVDFFRIMIVTEGQIFYSMLEVLPKQITKSQWNILRDDLEKEVIGLSQDFVRRNIGVGSLTSKHLPPEKLYSFLIIQKHSKAVLAALTDLKDKPKHQLQKEYRKSLKNKVSEFDSETIKRYLVQGTDSDFWDVPTKTVNYNIQENRILKKILFVYETELDSIISILESTKKTILQENKFKRDSGEKEEYILEFERSTDGFLTTAKKLRNMTGILKYQPWFQSVSNDKSGVIPHSLALDMRYGTLFKMYQELKSPNWSIQFDPQYSYTWKKSSSMYEMWCYIKICRGLGERFNIVSSDASLNFEFGNRLFFPYLEDGSCICFERDEILLKVYFDKKIPKKLEECTLYENPCYTVGKSNRPDIRIDIYTKEVENPHILGTIILECKYRKLSSYWFDPEKAPPGWNPKGSSKPQILAYYSDVRSKFMLMENASDSNWHPTKKVFVLTPDDNGVITSPKSSRDTEIENMALLPSEDNRYLNAVIESIQYEVDKVYNFEKSLIEIVKRYR